MKNQFSFARSFRLFLAIGGLLLAFSDDARAQTYRRSSPFGNYGPYITRPYSSYRYGAGAIGQSYYRAPVELYAPRNYGYRSGLNSSYYDYLYRPSYYWRNYAANPIPIIPSPASLPATYADPSSNRVAIQLKLPAADAKVWFAGVLTKQSGAMREFVTPRLDAGKRYQYKIRVAWTANGTQQERSRTIQIKPGKSVRLDFTLPQ